MPLQAGEPVVISSLPCSGIPEESDNERSPAKAGKKQSGGSPGNSSPHARPNRPEPAPSDAALAEGHPVGPPVEQPGLPAASIAHGSVLAAEPAGLPSLMP